MQTNKRRCSLSAWYGGVVKGGGYIKDDGSITPQAPLEKQRIKRNLSEGEKALSFLVKLHRERDFLFYS